MPRLRISVLAAAAAAAALSLTGCSSGGESAEGLSIVASTDVYGDIAAAIGGDLVEVTAIIDSAAQDPHSYEVSARDELRISRADLVVSNGAGYDAFIDSAVEATGTEAPQLRAVEYSDDWPGGEADGEHDHIEGFNEHVWYDPRTVARLAEAIAGELSELDPGHAEAYDARLAEFTAGIGDLEAALGEIATDHAGAQVFVTEPVPVYLTDAAGLENVTPDAFSEAVEEGQDVPPATLLAATRLIASGEVAVVIANAQTGGAETTAILDEADVAGIPAIEFTETLPDDQTYLSWMQQNTDALATALAE